MHCDIQAAKNILGAGELGYPNLCSSVTSHFQPTINYLHQMHFFLRSSKNLVILGTLSVSPAPELFFHLASLAPDPEIIFQIASMAPELVFHLVSPAPDQELIF